MSSDFFYEHIEVGNDVVIHERASFISSISYIHIGNKVLFGPNVTIRGGNHRYDIVGRYIYDVSDKEKRSKDDADVWIEDDVWIGCNVTILKGVTIGKGSIVGAGSVVTKPCPPYSIIAGVPARIIKMRFSPQEIERHEQLINKT